MRASKVAPDVKAGEADVIHHTVHGYQRGHRLLASSIELDETTSSLITRTSDSAPNYRSADGPYLTGYPLHDRRYVVARTWPVTGASRPNTVITHSLLLPSSGGLAEQARFLIELLREPIEPSRGSIVPIPTTHTRMPDSAVDAAGATQAIAYYDAGGGTIHESDESRREDLVFAVWDQLWSSCRRAMRFCTAPDAGRFLDQPGSMTFTNHADRASIGRTVHAPWHVVAGDLISPGPFRSFLHFVASGLRDFQLLEDFAHFYELSLRDDVEALRAVESLVATVAPDPRSLRRLKRRLLGFDGSIARWPVEPMLVLQALGLEPLGVMVSAEDASLANWIQAAWGEDAAAAVDVLVATRTGSTAEDPELTAPKDPTVRTARDGLSEAFKSEVVSLLTPGTFAAASLVNPVEVMRVTFAQRSSDLWTAWSELDRQQRTAMLRPVATPAADVLRSAVEALAGDSDALTDLIEAFPEAVDTVIDLASRKEVVASLPRLSRPASRRVRDSLATEDDARRLRVLAWLADPNELPRDVRYEAWKPLIRRDEDVPTAILYLVARTSKSEAGIHAAADAAIVLYEVLASDPAAESWKRLSPVLKSDSPPWDRCSRLTDDLARSLRDVGDSLLSDVIRSINDRDQAVAQALARSFDRRKNSRSIWDLINPFRW